MAEVGVDGCVSVSGGDSRGDGCGLGRWRVQVACAGGVCRWRVCGSASHRVDVKPHANRKQATTLIKISGLAPW